MYEIAEKLLEIKAVELDPKRTGSTLSEYAFRCCSERAYGDADATFCVVSALKSLTEEMCAEYGISSDSVVIVSASVRAIGFGFGLATESLSVPFAYALKNKVGFRFDGAQLGIGVRVIVVTDFVGNGYTVLNVVDALRTTGAIVIGVVAIVGSGSRQMKETLDAAHVLFKFATDFAELQKVAKEKGL